MQTEQKYFSECSFGQATKAVLLVKPGELDELAKHPHVLEKLGQPHIYFVCQRPRVRISSAGKRTSQGIRVVLDVAGQDTSITKEIVIPTRALREDMTDVRVAQNGAYFAFTDGTKDTTLLMPPEQLLQVAPASLEELSGLEVVYIGQAFGDSGSRSAVDRLKAHSTLQKVLAEQALSSWWMELVLLLFTFDDPQVFTKMDGRGKPLITGDADTDHFKTIMEEPLSEAESVTIAEASLIRYFQPYYNSHFKGNYPTTELQHLSMEVGGSLALKHMEMFWMNMHFIPAQKVPTPKESQVEDRL